MAVSSTFLIQVTPGNGGPPRLQIRGRVDLGNAADVLQATERAMARRLGEPWEVDLSGVEYFDSGGGAVLFRLGERLRQAGGQLRIVGSTPAIDGFLGLVDPTGVLQAPTKTAAAGHPLVQLGELALQASQDARQLVVFVGELILGLAEAVRHPRQVRWRDTWLYLHRCGVEGIPIVALISFLMGLITAFQAAVQLEQFGADIYVANLVGLSITRELGPLMTAIIAAGRSGAAFAAEIGTMKVSEEVDAMTTMGLDRTRFLVTPKVIALLIMLPCLTVLADVVGILGGLVVAVSGLELPALVYFRQLRVALELWDVFSGLLKSVVFAFLVAAVGCLRGFQATSGAESVGRITTSAIVAGIFLIILADAVFTLMFHSW